MKEYIVVSDLHIGRGRDPETGRYRRLEAFFYDDDFYSFCSWLCEDATKRGTEFKLVLNGDTFDLLRIDSGEPNPKNLNGVALTPLEATRAVTEMLDGHPRFVDGLARVIASGHSVVFIAGNHDIELQWKSVQDAVRKNIEERVSSVYSLNDISGRIEFYEWFLHEKGRLWIEHGNQYDVDNCFQHWPRGWTELMPDDFHKSEVGLPMGSLFQRYIYNNLGNITFIVPGRGATGRYIKWLIFNKPRLVLKTAASHVPLFLKTAWKSGLSRDNRQRLQNLHDIRMETLRSEVPQLDAITEMWPAASSKSVVRQMMTNFLRGAGAFAIVAMVVIALWFASVYGLTTLAAGIGLKSLFFIISNFGFIMLLSIGFIILGLKSSRSEVHPMRTAARKLGRTLDVPVVVFGHIHDEVVWSLSRGKGQKTKYFNTGTWSSVFTRDQLVPRERVQYTFLHVQENDGTLMRWSPGRDKPLQVILLDDDHPADEPNRPTVKAS